jgi:hypothetical protein
MYSEYAGDRFIQVKLTKISYTGALFKIPVYSMFGILKRVSKKSIIVTYIHPSKATSTISNNTPHKL